MQIQTQKQIHSPRGIQGRQQWTPPPSSANKVFFFNIVGMTFYWLKEMKLSEKTKEEIVWTVEQNSPVKEMYCYILQCFVQLALFFNVCSPLFCQSSCIFYLYLCLFLFLSKSKWVGDNNAMPGVKCTFACLQYLGQNYQRGVDDRAIFRKKCAFVWNFAMSSPLWYKYADSLFTNFKLLTD